MLLGRPKLNFLVNYTGVCHFLCVYTPAYFLCLSYTFVINRANSFRMGPDINNRMSCHCVCPPFSHSLLMFFSCSLYQSIYCKCFIQFFFLLVCIDLFSIGFKWTVSNGCLSEFFSRLPFNLYKKTDIGQLVSLFSVCSFDIIHTFISQIINDIYHNHDEIHVLYTKSKCC